MVRASERMEWHVSRIEVQSVVRCRWNFKPQGSGVVGESDFRLNIVVEVRVRGMKL
jgi:hypothetical protein